MRGRVQGVFFRASTLERALALSLRGHAENLGDGSVRVVAGGEEHSLAELASWLRTGPPMARVDELEIETIDPASIAWPADFRIC